MNQQQRAEAQKVFDALEVLLTEPMAKTAADKAEALLLQAAPALRQLLEQPADHSEQDLDMVDHGDELTIAYLDGVHTGKRLVKRVPLTDEQIDLLINGRGDKDDDDYVEPTGDGFGLTDEDLVKLVRRVEKHHGIEGTP